jgi:hypothetical protein
MFDPLSIDAPYDELQFITNLPAYDCNPGGFEMLDLIREIQTSGNYYWQGASFPNGIATTVPAGATVNGSIQVPQGTYVTSMTYYLLSGAAGYKIKIFDKGSKASIFYGDYCKDGLVTSDMNQGANPYGGTQPFGPCYVMSPFIINDPGVLGWEVVNLDLVNPQTIQVMLALAIPINKQSSSHMVVDRGY